MSHQGFRIGEAGAGQRSERVRDRQMSYPTSLVHPDKLGFEPRIGISWRPIPASTLVVRAGYGIYDDTSVYLGAAESMAEQAPFSTSLSQANSSACNLTLPERISAVRGRRHRYLRDRSELARGLCAELAAFRAARSALGPGGDRNLSGNKGHAWNAGISSRIAIRSVRTNPCPSCQSGFVYRTSGGNSTRQAGQLQLRRRLRSGFTASVELHLGEGHG